MDSRQESEKLVKKLLAKKQKHEAWEWLSGAPRGVTRYIGEMDPKGSILKRIMSKITCSFGSIELTRSVDLLICAPAYPILAHFVDDQMPLPFFGGVFVLVVGGLGRQFLGGVYFTPVAQEHRGLKMVENLYESHQTIIGT